MAFKQKIVEGLFARGKARAKERAARSGDSPATLEQVTEMANAMREGMNFLQKIVMMMTTPPKDVDHETITENNIKVDIFSIKTANDKAILYIHGGGWIVGQSKAHLNLCALLARETGAKVFSVDYRLAPEHPFPAGLDDTHEIYHFILKQGYTPKKITVMGDSAGGNLTLSLIHKLKDENHPLPGAAIALSPATDLNQDTDSWKKMGDIDPMLNAVSKRGKELLHLAYIRDNTADHHHVSPLLGDLKDFPPLFILVGGREVLLDDSLLFYEKAKAAGVDVTLDVQDDMFHVYPVFQDITEKAKIALGKMALFINMKT